MSAAACVAGKACSFTGHRVIAAAHRGKLAPMLARAIAYAYGEGCRRFYAGGALGFDTAAAKAVIEYKRTAPDVRLILLLPCRDQAERWSAADRRAYAEIVAAADEVLYIAERYREGCMRERNMRLAELCDMLVAYVERYGSGAAQTVRFAESLGKPVYNIYPFL